MAITEIENLHLVTRRKIHWLQKWFSFRYTTENNEVIAKKNRFRTAASLGACERLDALIIDARRQYILLVIIIITQVLTRHCIIVNIIAWN